MFTGCGSKDMTAAKWCKIQKKLADIGMEKYFDAFKGKEYDETAKSYEQYVNDCRKIYYKYYATADYLTEWQKGHKEEISECLKTNPKLDFRKIYGEKYDQFVMNVFYFLEEKVKRESEE